MILKSIFAAICVSSVVTIVAVKVSPDVDAFGAASGSFLGALIVSLIFGSLVKRRKP